MTDDELLALAKKAQKIVPGAWERDSIETDGHYGSGPDVSEGFDEFGIYADGDLLFDSTNTDRAEIEVEYDDDTKQAWNEISRIIFDYIAAASPVAIISMIDRRRAEVGKMWSASEEHRRDARHWEEKADTLSRNLAAEQRESSKLRAEVERLTRERDETLAAVRATMSRLMDERDAAESALAALAAAPDDGADRVISDLLIASAPYADMDETGRLPKAREQAERLLNEPDLSAKQRYANHYEEQIGFLVERFAEALSSKLRKAEGKYQYQGAWRRDSWHDALVQQIRRHMDKGDPLDVAAYCAFAWHHGWTLAAPHTSAESALAAAQKRIEVLDAALKECEEYFDNRADADGDSDGFHPNEEMRLLVEVRDALKESGNGDETVRPDQRGKDGD